MALSRRDTWGALHMHVDTLQHWQGRILTITVVYVIFFHFILTRKQAELSQVIKSLVIRGGTCTSFHIHITTFVRGRMALWYSARLLVIRLRVRSWLMAASC